MRTDNHFFPKVSMQYGQFDVQPSIVDGKLDSATVMFCEGNNKHGWRYSSAQLLGLSQTLKCIRYLGKCEGSEDYHIFKPEVCQAFGDDDHEILAWFELSDGGVGLNFTNLIEITDAIDSLFARYAVVE